MPVAGTKGSVQKTGQGAHAGRLLQLEWSPLDRQPDGVVLEDCEAISRQISSVLDVEDPINGEYTLEVSSPGMDRSLFKLEQYSDFIGHKLAVRLRVGFDGRRKFTGVLKAIEDDEVVLEMDGEEYLLPFELIDKANIVPTF